MKLQPRDLQGAPPGAAYLASTPCFCPLSDPTVHVTLLQQAYTPAPCYWGDLGPFIRVEPEACLTQDIQSVLGGGMDG